MPGAPNEWCPDWYVYFKSAEVLRVPPWELAGFTYESAADAPVCWRGWAYDFQIAHAYAADKRQQDMMKAAFGG